MEKRVEFKCLICHKIEYRNIIINKDTQKLFWVCDSCKKSLRENYGT